MKTVRENWAMICPDCGSDHALDVCIIAWARLVPDGSDTTQAANGDHEWTQDSACYCHSCGWTGKVNNARAAAKRAG